jgi:HSP20 family protein
VPEVEVDSDEEGWTVTARLAGFAPDEVELDVDARELHIRSRPPSESSDEDGEQPRRRTFDYRLSLPGDVDVDKVDATMDHGLLTVRLPRVTRNGRRQITIGRT